MMAYRHFTLVLSGVHTLDLSVLETSSTVWYLVCFIVVWYYVVTM